ncbi:MAG: hypothetical protein AAFN77_09060 [Planctomycetota bacterium]
MLSYHRQVSLYLLVSAIMFAAGLTLPLGLHFVAPEVSLPPWIYDFLCYSGILGMCVFSLAKRMSSKLPSRLPESSDSVPAA